MKLFYIFLLAYLAVPMIQTQASAISLQNIITLKEKGFFRSSLGYSIHSKNTLWKLSKSSPKGKVLIYKQKGSVFSVRVKKIAEPNVTLYLKNNLSTYKHFGLKVTKAKKIKFKNHLAYLIYSHPKNKDRLNLYSTQLLTAKNHRLVSMTCTGKKSNQKDWTSECAKIMKNFSWTN
ncbi:MAG: hypothetical protein HAW63_02745 [Bdellovibrionaceae bacterium]|nr:hypothetical protein [Pseudobdellovibrionaceae bacterium]